MKILLTRNKSTFVSQVDYHFLRQWKWSALKTRKRWYAVRMEDGIYVYMHRLIAERCGLDMSRQIDHKDGDGLNNKRSNLRSASHAQNLQNRGKPNNNTSGIKGVHWDQSRSKWRVEIQAFGKRKFLGRFVSKRAAIQAYRNAAKDLHKEFAKC